MTIPFPGTQRPPTRSSSVKDTTSWFGPISLPDEYVEICNKIIQYNLPKLLTLGPQFHSLPPARSASFIISLSSVHSPLRRGYLSIPFIPFHITPPPCLILFSKAVFPTAWIHPVISIYLHSPLQQHFQDYIAASSNTCKTCDALTFSSIVKL